MEFSHSAYPKLHLGFTLCSPRLKVILERCGIKEIQNDFDGWRVRAYGRERLLRRTEVDHLFYDDDYNAIDNLVKMIGLDLTAHKRIADKRRAFRTKQRSIERSIAVLGV